MNELELDIRIRYMMNFFKGIYDASEDFNVYDAEVTDFVIDEEDRELAAR